MQYLLIGLFVLVLAVGSFIVEAVLPGMLNEMFKKDSAGRYSTAQRIGLGIAITITGGIVVWSIYHAVTELNRS